MRPGFILVSVAFLAAACERASAPDDAYPMIVGTWIVEDIDYRGVIDNARLDATFSAEGQVSGVAACNNYTGTYAYAQGVISVGPLAATKKMCPPALMDMESKMLARLSSVTDASYDETMALILSDTEGRLLLRRADEPARAVPPPETESNDGLVVSGVLRWPDDAVLPDDALLTVRLEDVSLADAPSRTLAEDSFSPRGGPPATFSLAVMEAVDERARLAVRAEIRSGPVLLYVTDTHNDASGRRGRRNMEIELVPVRLSPGSGAGELPVAPSPVAFDCGGDLIDIVFEEGAAYITGADGVTVTLDRIDFSGGPDASRTFSNGRMTLIQEAGGGQVLFGRGRMIPRPCEETTF